MLHIHVSNDVSFNIASETHNPQQTNYIDRGNFIKKELKMDPALFRRNGYNDTQEILNLKHSLNSWFISNYSDFQSGMKQAMTQYNKLSVLLKTQQPTPASADINTIDKHSVSEVNTLQMEADRTALKLQTLAQSCKIILTKINNISNLSGILGNKAWHEILKSEDISNDNIAVEIDKLKITCNNLININKVFSKYLAITKALNKVLLTDTYMSKSDFSAYQDQITYYTALVNKITDQTEFIYLIDKLAGVLLKYKEMVFELINAYSAFTFKIESLDLSSTEYKDILKLISTDKQFLPTSYEEIDDYVHMIVNHQWHKYENDLLLGPHISAYKDAVQAFTVQKSYLINDIDQQDINDLYNAICDFNSAATLQLKIDTQSSISMNSIRIKNEEWKRHNRKSDKVMFFYD